MADVLVVGGGPAGLSAALFAGKNGLDVTVFDTDKTWMHKAHLFNYPGIGSIDGSNYLSVLREQVDDFGVDRQQGVAVDGVESTGDGFTVATEEGSSTATISSSRRGRTATSPRASAVNSPTRASSTST